MTLVLSGDSPSFSGTFQGGTLTLGTALTYNWNGLTNNTYLEFTGIPSWVKRITVMLNGVSTNGASPIQIQLGTSGGMQTSGYVSSSGWAGSTGQYSTSNTGFICESTSSSASTSTLTGAMTISLQGSNNWVEQTGMYASSNTIHNVGAGGVPLSGTLDRIRLTTVNGTDTFDAGSVNILYEG